MPDPSPPRLGDRRFAEIDRDNFDTVLATIGPRLALEVDDRLRDDGGRLAVELRFASVHDFEPEGVVRQVDPLRRLLESRQRLQGLLFRIEGSSELGAMVSRTIREPGELEALASSSIATPGALDDPI